MDVKEIQKRLDAMAPAMAAKGLVVPSATLYIVSEQKVRLTLHWEDAAIKAQKTYGYFGERQSFTDENIKKSLDDADAFIAALPGAEAAKFKAFMSAVAAAVDMGRQNGIDVEFVNPLVETLKRLSENALTDQRAA